MCCWKAGVRLAICIKSLHLCADKIQRNGNRFLTKARRKHFQKFLIASPHHNDTEHTGRQEAPDSISNINGVKSHARCQMKETAPLSAGEKSDTPSRIYIGSWGKRDASC